MGNAMKKSAPKPQPKMNGSGPFFANEHKSKHHKSSKRQVKERDRKEKESIASSNKSSKSKKSSTTQVKPIHTNTGSHNNRTRLNDMNSTRVIEV
ncbi:hypothetical protein PRIPAC_75908 [Pristionchus pacificus]|uniref:Uncharacterized protein n=1 Tax=Pristionchus pacificus TaxID=54126 RepID=A0A454XS95_PRIPA|nr:hypothetical protein PRIPAC_75908 [Pristionchus pacificus]|eukprot:PDM64719.1 hypothetical protein PRIPAC_52975 [Pristionchus pacificus]